MNKLLLVFLIIVIIAAGVFYFVYFRPQQESAVPVSQVEQIDTSFNLTVVNELNESFSTFGNVPVTVDSASLRKNNSNKANDPFYN